MWLCAPRERVTRETGKKNHAEVAQCFSSENTQERNAPIKVVGEASTHHPMAEWCSALMWRNREKLLFSSLVLREY